VRRDRSEAQAFNGVKVRVPFVGGRPESFVCVHVVGPVPARTPVRICSSNDPLALKRKLQIHHWVPLDILHKAWVGDVGLARRIENECRDLLAGKHLRGGWYAIEPQLAVETIEKAAGRRRIPLLSDGEYRKLIPSKDDRDEMILRRAGATAAGLRRLT
jgi:hypothetical protein